MREGSDPYGPRGSLTREQIEEIQVYRANNEPGYRERYYRKDGTRKSLEIYDESGQTPPQLTRLSENSPWARARDVPAPPKPYFLDNDYISVGADTVSSGAGLRLLEESAQTRHLAIRWDNLMSEWKTETGGAHQVQQTHESAGLWGEAKGSYKESHTAMGDAAEALGENAARHHYIAERYRDSRTSLCSGRRAATTSSTRCGRMRTAGWSSSRPRAVRERISVGAHFPTESRYPKGAGSTSTTFWRP
ncbi:hypothetical protein F9278_22220 [Streptomyces phaeolivaceus]|uniref:Uncharacterized protein n=1 Tax=Streptomyces phaeolivaceus TaxID=2653200 RepID=A0A5P8K5T2_9ACTN|nr:hypothetical protein [Streptomyces phaeolivaceus]QFQ98451.1 hypothetical protein F9278_22220 [Streptomyces phaeolivaceus]